MNSTSPKTTKRQRKKKRKANNNKTKPQENSSSRVDRALGRNQTGWRLTEKSRRVDCEETEVSSSQRPVCPLLRQRPRSTSPVEEEGYYRGYRINP